MEATLINKLLSRIPVANPYPSKGKKKAKKKPTYIFISEQYFERKGDDGVITMHRIGFTYRKK